MSCCKLDLLSVAPIGFSPLELACRLKSKQPADLIKYPPFVCTSLVGDAFAHQYTEICDKIREKNQN